MPIPVCTGKGEAIGKLRCIRTIIFYLTIIIYDFIVVLKPMFKSATYNPTFTVV